MGKWEMVRLGDVCEKASSNIVQKDLENNFGDYPIYGAAGLIKYVDFYKQPDEYIAIVKDGAGIGRTTLMPAKSSVTGTMQYILPKKAIDTKYLCFAIIYMNLAKHFTGATIPHIYFKDYCKEQLPLPPLDEQKRIAKNLDLASEIVKGYKEQLAELDKLVQSVFYEMFGDPVTNNKKFEIKLGKDFFKLSSGKPVPPEKRFETGIPAYGGNGVSWYTDDILFEQDTLIVGRVGFQSGNVRLARGPLWVTDNAMYISEYQSSEYSLDFLCALMKHIDFTRFQDAGDLKKITQKPFMQMGFISPPLPLQTRFASIVTEIEAQRAQVQQALTEAENLFNSLMQEYFD